MARAKAVRNKLEAESRLLYEVEAIVCTALGLVLGLSFLSYVPDSPELNQVGPVGYAVANVLIQCLGYGSYLFPLLLISGAFALFTRRSGSVSPVRFVGAVALLLVAAVALGLYRPDVDPALAGGWVGGFLATLLQQAFGQVGSWVLVVALVALVFIMVTGRSPSQTVARAGGAVIGVTVAAVTTLGEKIEIALRALGSLILALRPRLQRPPVRQQSSSLEALAREAVPEIDKPLVFGEEDPVEVEEPVTIETERPNSTVRITRASESVAEARAKRDQQVEEETDDFLFDVDDSEYERPPVELLGSSDECEDDVDEDTLIGQSKILEQKLATFGISGSVTAVRSGPVITTYEFEPDAGIKVSRIVSLCDDLTMALRAHGVRIVAPIPGKNVVGIEVSNRRRAIVGLRDLVDSDEFFRLASTLGVVLGRDTTGVPSYADLAKMPHLLMAGATGSGKSVALNSIILSILFKATPRDVRFIMIDPKMLELSVYEGIPHLLVPVVTDVKKAAAALANVMREMDRRFELMKDLRVRNIDDYNRRIAEQQAEEEELEEEELEEEEEYELEEGEAGEEAEGDEEEAEEEYELEEEDDGLQHEHLPRVVVIVDELADLMMTVGREVEESITRLAQKARAAGIHLIVATQRPSVDVITGLIKANFPARISFQVTSRHDSKTILDAVGAERLLGMGDMLYLAPGTSVLRRLHGAFITERETIAVVEFLRQQGSPEYRLEMLESPTDSADDVDDEEFFDELYDRAVDVVTRHGQGSTSWVQRQLGIGYNRAARIMEQMEREGLVGPADGSRPRKVLVPTVHG